jgi:hypothetical protein
MPPHDEFSGLDQLVSTGALSLKLPTVATQPPPSNTLLRRHDILASSSPVVRAAVTASNAALRPPVTTRILTSSTLNQAAATATAAPQTATPSPSAGMTRDLSTLSTIANNPHIDMVRPDSPVGVAYDPTAKQSPPVAPKAIYHRSQSNSQDKGTSQMETNQQATSEQQLNFISKAITTGAAASPTTKSQYSFRPTRLVIPSNIGVFFSVSNIRLGTDTQYLNNIECPALVYAENAVGTAFVLGIANPSVDITLDVINNDAATHDFRASMFGQVWK